MACSGGRLGRRYHHGPMQRRAVPRKGVAVAPVARSELCRLRTLGSHGALNRLGDGS